MSVSITSETLRPTHRSTKVILAALVAGLPGLFLGYGTDIDIANVLRAGDSFFAGDYQLSRPPGNLPYEIVAYVLDMVLGAPGVVLASLVAATAALFALVGLLQAEDIDPLPAVVLVAVCPWWWIASTSLGDYLFAITLVLVGARARTRGSVLVAGVCFGLAIGVRASTVGLVGAWLLADVWGRRRDAALPVVATGAVAVVVGAACFIPVWWASGRTLDFMTTETQVTNLTTLLGRWAVKNLAFWGLIGGLAAVVGLATRLREGLGWSTSVVTRFAVLGLVWAELVYLRFPWKPLHLLPALVCVAVLLAPVERRIQWLVGVGFALHALVTLTVATPDVPHRATSGEIDLELRPGVLLTDIDCRLDDREQGDWAPIGSTEAYDRAVALFDCQAQLWRSD